MSIAATATYIDFQSAPGVFQYTLTLNNTGSTNIGTFWFAWDDVPDQDFMSAQPSNVGTPSGWTDILTTHTYTSGTGHGIEWISLSSPIAAGTSSSSFTFTSTETPAEFATVSVFDPTFPVPSAFVYIGGAFGDPGFQLTATAAPACFCRGTMILTERGEVAVEALAVGDRVRTLSGAAKPIRWIGMGRDLVTRANKLARPVVVRAGALGEDVPRRDLYLTHGHALYFDGVLIPVENLVNHRSIAWDETARVVEYYHIEIDDHDVLFAEAAPAESYYDAGNRALFLNTREGSEAGADKPIFAPVLNGGDVVERVWAALHARAGGQIAKQIETDTTDDPDLHLVVDGERQDPASVVDCAYTFAVDQPPAGTLRLCSRSGVPSLLGLTRHDHRRLGVAVRRITLRQAGIVTSFEHAGPVFTEGGCHKPEDGYSWTDGEFTLPSRLFAHLTGPFTLTVDIDFPGMRYPIADAVTEAA